MEVKDKRLFKRVNHDLQVRYFFGPNTSPVRVFTQDISCRGMRIQNAFKIEEPFQFPMDIVLDAESDTVMKVIARVAWQRLKENEWETGLEFVHIEPADRELLEKFVETVGEPAA